MPTVVPQVAAIQQAESQQSSASENSNGKDWSEEKVQTWLKENKLESLCSPFSEAGTDGKDLKELYNMYCESALEFKADMKSEYKLGLASIARFIRLLKELFE